MNEIISTTGARRHRPYSQAVKAGGFLYVSGQLPSIRHRRLCRGRYRQPGPASPHQHQNASWTPPA